MRYLVVNAAIFSAVGFALAYALLNALVAQTYVGPVAAALIKVNGG